MTVSKSCSINNLTLSQFRNGSIKPAPGVFCLSLVDDEQWIKEKQMKNKRIITISRKCRWNFHCSPCVTHECMLLCLTSVGHHLEAAGMRALHLVFTYSTTKRSVTENTASTSAYTASTSAYTASTSAYAASTSASQLELFKIVRVKCQQMAMI